MSDFHLKRGSPCPPYNGTLRLYNMRFCPYAQRTVLMLNAKKIPYENVNINLTDKPEWLTSKSPLGKVPALEIEENVTIYESLITAEYLDDKYPEPALTSKDPLRRAQDKLIIENFGKCTTSYYKILMLDVDESKLFHEGLTYIQDELQKRGSKFLFGNQPGMVDYMIWPWFERFGILSMRGFESMHMDKDKYALLFSWVNAMKEDPAVKPYYLNEKTHNKFFCLRQKNDENCYNILL